MNKPSEIEGFLDIYLIRPMGSAFVHVLRHTPATPNMLSAAAVAAAVGGAFAYYYRTPTGAFAGLLFMLLTSALDSADGQLARATGRGSKLGPLIDGVCDNLSFLSMYLAILFSWIHYVDRQVPVVVAIMVLAAISHSAQSALADYQRQLYLIYCFGEERSEDERPEALRARIAREVSPLRVLVLRLYLNYSNEQRMLLGSSDRLHRRFKELTAGRPKLKATFARRYRDTATTLVKWWALGATNIHKCGIAASAFLPLVFAAGPLHKLGTVAYFFWALLLNIPLVALIVVQRGVNRRLLADLESMAAE